MKDETAKKVLERMDEMEKVLNKTKILIANIHSYINQASSQVESTRLTVRQSCGDKGVSHG